MDRRGFLYAFLVATPATWLLSGCSTPDIQEQTKDALDAIAAVAAAPTSPIDELLQELRDTHIDHSPVTQCDQDFDWREYVHISTDISEKRRNQIEEALDILSTDAFCQRDLRDASILGNGKVTITHNTDEKSGYDNLVHIIHLNFDEIKALEYRGTDGEYHAFSLPHVLTHEIKHAASPRDRIYWRALEYKGIEHEEKLEAALLFVEGGIIDYVNPIMADLGSEPERVNAHNAARVSDPIPTDIPSMDYFWENITSRQNTGLCEQGANGNALNIATSPDQERGGFLGLIERLAQTTHGVGRV